MFSIWTICKAIIVGFFTGFIASIPLGPSGIESVNRSISQGFKEGFKVSLGTVSADITYILIINLGFFTLLSKHRYFQSIFWIVSGIVLILFNKVSFKKDNKKDNNKDNNKANNSTNYLSKYNSNGFLMGYLITFINPTTPSLWIALSATVLNVWRNNGAAYFAFSTCAMILGSISWFCLLNFLVSKGIKKLKSNYAQTTSKLLNYFLIILGIIFIVLGVLKFIV